MMVRYPVDRRRGDVHDALHAMAQRGVEYITGAFHVGGVDIFGTVERQGRGGVDDVIFALHHPVQEGLVADITLDDLDAVPLGVIELLHVERGEGVAPRLEMAYEVDPQESGSAGYENSPSIHASPCACPRKRRAL